MSNEELRILKNTIEQMACDADDKGLTDFGLRLSVADAFTLCKLMPPRRWIPCSERLPEDIVLVNVVWVNRDPPTYYEKIKNVPISGTACRYKGNWYWDSPACIDQLAETGENKFDLVDYGIDITHWMPLPEPPEEKQNETD